MSRKQIKHNSVSHKTILLMSIVWWIIAFNSLYAESTYPKSVYAENSYAERPSYFYASDIIKDKKNANDLENPYIFQNKKNLQPPRYLYAPPLQKLGSNPMIKPQYNYQSFPDNTSDENPYMRQNQYHYPPPIQKIGSNPFIRQND